jgi:hypothetical protein
MKSPLLVAKASVLKCGEKLAVDAYHSKQNNVISGSFRFDSFGGLRIGHGNGTAYSSAWAEVYSDRIEVYNNTFTPFLVGCWHHGLSLAHSLTVLISVGRGKAVLQIGTAGGWFETPEFDFRGCGTECFAEAIDGTLLDARITYLDNDKFKDVWLFGDSYMDMYPKYLIAGGFGNFAMDGHSGRASRGALLSLRHALEHFPAPKMLIWALGMNDADEEDRINENWHEVIQEVLLLCQDAGIVPVLCTIPNTPTRSNAFKNEFMLGCGCRICHLASAVQSAGQNEWFPGTLRSDNVHPTELGSRLLALQMMCDVPEIKDCSFKTN